MVGTHDDHGLSQAHYEGGKYVVEKVPGTKMIYIDRVNPTDRPNVTIPQLADDMVQKGAKLVIANSVKLSVLLATPGGIALALPVVLRFVNLVRKELQSRTNN